MEVIHPTAVETDHAVPIVVPMDLLVHIVAQMVRKEKVAPNHDQKFNGVSRIMKIIINA